MWYIIKAEIENAKYFWMVVCIPLLLSIAVLLWVGDIDGEREKLLLKVVINMAKGFAIILVLLVLRSVLGYVGKESMSSLHLKLPVTLIQLGIVRICNMVALWICAFALVLLNLHLLPREITTQALPTLFFSGGLTLFIIGLTIVVMDIFCLFPKLIAYRHWAAMVTAFFIPGIFFFHRTTLAQSITPTNTTLLNLLGFALLALSVYTFTCRTSYLLKPEQ